MKTNHKQFLQKVNRENRKNKSKQHTPLFEDTSYSQPSYNYPPSGYNYSNQPQSFYNPTQLSQGYYQQPQMPTVFSDPMANMAVQYGHTLAGQGTQIINQNIEKYVSHSNLKYYFAVDNTYVIKKLALLLFPFLHKDWSMSHSQDGPVAPRFDINAKDLYIPVMAFVTYTLLAGVLLGIQDKFSPEQLGVIASTALVWSVLEVCVLLLTKYILSLPASPSSPSLLDWIAYSFYKYVGMILILISSILMQTTGYYVTLVWTSLSISYFLMKSLKVSLLSGTEGTKRCMYLLMLVCLLQPFLLWWLTRHLAVSSPIYLSDVFKQEEAVRDVPGVGVRRVSGRV